VHVPALYCPALLPKTRAEKLATRNRSSERARHAREQQIRETTRAIPDIRNDERLNRRRSVFGKTATALNLPGVIIPTEYPIWLRCVTDGDLSIDGHRPRQGSDTSAVVDDAAACVISRTSWRTRRMRPASRSLVTFCAPWAMCAMLLSVIGARHHACGSGPVRKYRRRRREWRPCRLTRRSCGTVREASRR
jgi:hypothetical protein